MLGQGMTPSRSSMRRMLQLQPEVARLVLNWGHLLHTTDDPLTWVGMMRELNYPAPDVSRINDTNGVIACALFTFRYTSERPVLRPLADCDDVMGRAFMVWRMHTHYACGEQRQERVETALLCLKRVCRSLPESAARHAQHVAAAGLWTRKV